MRFLKGDITDLPALLNILRKEDISKVVHTAAVTDLEILVHQPFTAQKIMVEGHMNVLEAAKMLSIPRVVFTSSIAVYAPVQYEPIDENHPVLLAHEGPTLASYSSFKLAGESLGLFYWAYHGVDFVALRLSAVYGVGMRYPMYVKPIVENSLRGQKTVFPTGREMRRDYTYIKDVVAGVLLALDVKTSLANRIFNISYGAPLRNALEAAQIVKQHLPEAQIAIGEGVSELEARDLKNRGRLSIRSAQKELGFIPQFSLEEGIKDYIQQFRAFLKAGI